MKYLYLLCMLALAAIGAVYYHGHELEQENAHESDRIRERANHARDGLRAQGIAYAESGYKQGVEWAKEERTRNLEAGKNSLLVEQLYETKLINLRAERDEKIKQANEQNAPLP